jgi:hypothetical protein
MFIKEGKNKIVFFIAVVSLIFFVFGLKGVSAASLWISSNKTSLNIGDTAVLWVRVNTQDVSINNAEATIQYPTDLVEVLSVSRSGSIFSLWIEEPAFSNSTGVVSFNGGVPTPGYTGSSGGVVSISVRAKKAGQANFSYSGAAVRANDGLGGNVLNSKSGVTLNIVQKEDKPEVVVPPVEPKKEEPAPKEDQKEGVSSLKVSSQTHPNQDSWYRDRKVVFQWTIPAGVDAVQTAIDDNDLGNPRVIYRPAISAKELEVTNDGVWYFKVRARKSSTWGPVSTYLVRVDTVPPEKKNVDFSYDNDSGKLNIFADIKDETSGVDYYEIYINDVLKKNVPVNDFIDGKYSIGIDSPGENTVKLVAFDKAGNSVEASGVFQSNIVPIIPKPELDPIKQRVSIGDRVLISGKTQLFNSDVTINIRKDDGEALTVKTISNSEGVFFAFTPALESGRYEVWASVDLNGDENRSEVITILAANRFILIVGPYSISGLLLIILATLLLIVVIFSLAFSVYCLFKFKPRRKTKGTSRRNKTKVHLITKK